MFALPVAAITSTQSITTAIQTFVGPAILLYIGFLALPFLKERQFMRLFEYVAIAIAVLILFYYPTFIQGLASYFSNTL